MAQQYGVVPAFTYDAPAWFRHVDASWYGLDDLTDLDRFRAVVRALPADVAALVPDVLAAPPAEDKYAALKAAVVRALGKSTEAALAELEAIQLDGRRPSQLFTAMESLNRAAGDHMSNTLLRYRHKCLLPPAIRLQLTGRDVQSSQEYMALVDEIFDAYNAAHPHAASYLTPSQSGSYLPPAVVSGVAARRPLGDVVAPGPSEHTQIRHPAGSDAHGPVDAPAMLARLGDVVLRLESCLVPRQRRPSAEYCYYHDRFGEAARNCRPPCSWRRARTPAGNDFGGRRHAV